MGYLAQRQIVGVVQLEPTAGGPALARSWRSWHMVRINLDQATFAPPAYCNGVREAGLLCCLLEDLWQRPDSA